MFLLLRRLAPAAGLLLASLALAGCNSTGLSGAARALSGAGPGPETPEFIQTSRPAEPLQHIPVGVTPPARATPVRNASDVTKLEKELEGQRDRTKAFARRPTPRSPYDGSIPRRATPPKVAPASQGAQ